VDKVTKDILLSKFCPQLREMWLADLYYYEEEMLVPMLCDDGDATYELVEEVLLGLDIDLSYPTPDMNDEYWDEDYESGEYLGESVEGQWLMDVAATLEEGMQKVMKEAQFSDPLEAQLFGMPGTQLSEEFRPSLRALCARLREYVESSEWFREPQTT
jgi:hypothetical protein